VELNKWSATGHENECVDSGSHEFMHVKRGWREALDQSYSGEDELVSS